MPLTGFHPVVREWFAERLGEPTPPQVQGWPAIRAGHDVLIAAPTGTGKTLAAFLHALDSLLQQGTELPDATRVLYISPLRALSNDVQKNLQGPLAELRERDPDLPDVRVLVRTGDTPQRERQAMKRTPPHILVTTPESLYILLTSDGGRALLQGVQSVVVDEIHAMLGDKRGAHLALSLERLDTLVESAGGRRPQRIGLSATQKPLSDVGHFLVGSGREAELIDVGHLRELDLAMELPPSELQLVCSHEQWAEIYERMAELIREHRTTLVFVNTRKVAERVAAQLSKLLGEDVVTSHHGSLSRERRLDAEQRLKAGELKALVATASLELGIDVGDVDLVIQTGVTSSIATFLQRVGRAGHHKAATPKGRIFPLTRDELMAAVALLDSVARGELDRTPQPAAPLDILVQQVVAACAADTWDADELFALARRAWPYRNLTREAFDATIGLHTTGRLALLHHDGVNNRLRGTKRARLPAMTSGGAIPDTTEYTVVQDPEGTVVGTVHEDFAVEASVGDIFQLGNTSWEILRVTGGTMRVADAHGTPPSLPFWIAEGPSRTRELSASVSRLREHFVNNGTLPEPPTGVPAAAIAQVEAVLGETQRMLGALPTTGCIIAERFFDETGGQQLVVHSPYGGRINRAYGMALRKRFCRSFGFELQAAASEDGILLSLGPQHSFPLGDVFNFLHPDTVEEVLIQALLDQPIFQARWRWNVTRSLVVPRTQGGKRVPPPLLRMRADDALVAAFPEATACPENLDSGDLKIPMDHPMVRQTFEDCLYEALDLDGLIELLRGIRDGSIETHAVDVPEPSPLACAMLNLMPYAFLDDAPLEERRTQAVARRRTIDSRTADDVGELDATAVARVREEAWPDPADAEEVHEALLWMGAVRDDEAERHGWSDWLAALAADERVLHDDGRWFAVEASREPVEVLRGRMEALGPVFADAIGASPVELAQLEGEGRIMRCRLEGREAWCDRRLLARIHRYTLDRLRQEIQPVTIAQYLQFLACWQHVDPDHKLEGPAGVAEVIRQLAGFDAPASAWESDLLPARMKAYRPEWLDQLMLGGAVAWGRLWGNGAAPIRTTPVCLVQREDWIDWLSLAEPGGTGLSGNAAAIADVIARHGATFPQELETLSRLLPEHFEAGLGELIGRGRITCDTFGGVRRLLAPASKRAPHPRRDRRRVGRYGPMGRLPVALPSSGRWSVFRSETPLPAPEGYALPGSDFVESQVAFVATTLLDRYGVICRRLLAREQQPVPWRDLVRVLRLMELRGDVRGGRFIAGIDGEQYALPEAIKRLRAVRREGQRPAVQVSASDPLNLLGILTPDKRVARTHKQRVTIGAVAQAD